MKAEPFVSRAPFKELLKVKVKVVVPRHSTVPGLADRVNPGRPTSTFSVADAAPLLPALEVRSPDMLTYPPPALPVTSTLIVQLVEAAIEPVVREMVDPPSGAVRATSMQEVE